MVQNTNKYVYAFWSRTPDKQHGNALYPWISDRRKLRKSKIPYNILYMWHSRRHNLISAGASGAIFGIFGVLLVMIFKSRKQLGQVSAPRLILLFILMVFGNMQEGVDWMAHLGGAVTGVVIALAIYRPGNKPLHL